MPSSRDESSSLKAPTIATITFLIFISLNQFFTSCTPATTATNLQTKDHDKFHEDLYLKPLADGKLFAHFQFTTFYRKNVKDLKWENKIEILPLSIIDLVATTDLQELHFSLTKGNWDNKNWGYQVRSSPPGAQIRAQFSRHNENPNKSWSRLTNLLAAKFCASLTSADEKTLAPTKLAFQQQSSSSTNSTTQKVYYSHLPEETLCTENLTPWKKLLPCYTSSGLASLLNAVQLFKSSHSSLSIDLSSTKCTFDDKTSVSNCEQVQLIQSISVVFNPLQQFEGKQTWSIAKIFGNQIQGQCSLSSKSQVHVDISQLDDENKLYPKNSKQLVLNLKSSSSWLKYATFEVEAPQQTLNIGIKQSQLFKRPAFSSRPTIPVLVRTQIAGLAGPEGTLVATLTNKLNQPIRVTYLDVVPYFLRVYLHTLIIRTKSGQEIKPDKLNFDLSKEKTPTLIELSINLPANSETQVSYDFERVFLRWTDFRPDANKGVLLSSTMIAFSNRFVTDHLVLPLCATYGDVRQIAGTNSSYEFVNSDDELLRVYARPLLVILPTPDFSMPYNVLCLVCTVLVTAFGPIHNMTTRRPVIMTLKNKKDESNHENTEQEEASDTKKTHED